MAVSRIISYDEVPTILPSDTGSKVLDLMDENNIAHLPVVADDKYIALVHEDDLLNWDTPEKPISASDLLRYSPAVVAHGHAFEALRLAYSQNLSVVPVVDNENKYVGVVTRDSLLHYFAEKSGIDNPGGIIVLEMNPMDYSLYEIARICENEDVTIISSQLYTNRETGKIELTLKTNRTNLDAVAATYERFGYTVKEVYGEHSNRDDMKDRYELLMTYLNM